MKNKLLTLFLGIAIGVVVGYGMKERTLTYEEAFILSKTDKSYNYRDGYVFHKEGEYLLSWSEISFYKVKVGKI